MTVTDESKPFDLSKLDHQDVVLRGMPYVRHRHMIEYCHDQIAELEVDVPRLRYEHEIAQAICDKETDPQMRENLQDHASMVQEALAKAEQDLADSINSLAFHQAMAAAMAADLGDKAALYEWVLVSVSEVAHGWDEEMWEQDMWEEGDIQDLVLESGICPITLETCPLIEPKEDIEIDPPAPPPNGGRLH
jgi:protein subunit release factor A